MNELQELRRNADRLFSICKAKKRIYELYPSGFFVTLEEIKAIEIEYKAAERLCQLKRKELRLPYILNNEEQ